ncbi:MAG: pyrroline-5-carboxylate reductase dimerization domain-containing protein [Paracoccaceae bacterium]
MKLGILGATGWLGQALGLRLIGQGLWPEGDLIVANRSGKRDSYAAHTGVIWADVAGLCAASDVIVIAVRPEDFPLAGFDGKGKLVVSFMTVWTHAKLARLMPDARIVRAMPNGGATLGRSYTPWVAADISATDANLVATILGAMGEQDRVADEGQLNYLAALSGSGSAYPALMAQAMLVDAKTRGLPDAIAVKAVEAVICGSAEFLQGRMGELGDILDLYRAYKGITAAGLDAAEVGLTAAIKDALTAATAKASALDRD